jgi:signal transduction histidine kinase/CheY-like chemotaxis protein/HPt (histidine-containing phosphotransfer) domain-containing protein
MKQRSTFLTKLLLTAFAVAAPLLALHLYSLYRQKAQDEAAVVSAIRTRADNAARALDAAFGRVDRIVSFLASRKELQTADAEHCGQLIKGLTSVDPVLANIGAVDLDGRLLCLSAQPQAPRPSYRNAPWFEAALEATSQGHWYFGKPYFGDVTRKHLVNIVAPLNDPAGRRIGLIAAAIDLGYVSERLLTSADMTSGSVVTLADADGTIIARDSEFPRFVGKQVPSKLLAQAEKAGDRTFVATISTGIESIVAVSKLEHYGLRVGAGSPIETIAAKSLEGFRRSALAAVVAGLIGLATALYGVRRLNEPLRSLARSARALAAGDADARADEKLPGEFHDLAVEFNAMLDARLAGEASRRAQAAAVAASQAKSEFLANMSHEIRTPMNAILGLTGLALRTELTPKQHDYLSKAKIAADSLLALIDQILDFSKIEAGKLDLEQREFTLDDVLNRVTVIVGHNAQQKGLELLMGVAADVPQHLVGDAGRLVQVLVNLCNNAVKFTPAGEIVVAIERVEHGPSHDATLRFSVRDSGIGISAEELARLFRPFAQADATTSRKFGGTGLGLAISKQLVELMGGSISATSVPGQGSEFSFTVGFALPSGATSQAPAATLPDLRDVRVLVVDDSLNARDVLGALLRTLGCRVTAVDSAEACLAELEASDGAYDIVLMDWKLPGVDGFEAAQRIRRHARLPRQPRIVMVTAYGDEGVARRAQVEGLDGCLTKPVTGSTLLDTIVTALGHVGVTPASAPPAAAGDPQALAALRGREVLLVEDNEFNQLVASELLSSVAGMRVSVAANGPQALESLQARRFDAVLMDVQMPEMDGYETTRRIRSNPAFAALPIIAMTAHATARDRELCLAAGMDDYVTKPFDPQALFAMLAHWVAATPAAPSPAFRLPPPEHGISFELGLKHCLGRVDLYDKIARRFVAEQSNTPDAIRHALDAGESDKASGMAHSLVSTAGTLGASALSEIARDLQIAIDAGESQRWPSLVDALRGERAVVDDALRAYLSGKDEAARPARLASD